MRIDEIIAGSDRPVFSFEFFPPKSEEGEANLFRALGELRELSPSFVSVTYGAGGTTREKTVELVARIKREYGLEAMAHFTCVGASADELRETLRQMREAGVDNVLALRGDAPEGQDEWTATEGGLRYSTELIRLIGESHPFAVGAACFPEVHPEAVDADSDMGFLREKVQAGARFLITQLFFDNRLYYEFVARAREAGVEVPIIPGIMPVTNFEQLKRFTAMCGASIPADLRRELEQRADDPQAVIDFGVAYATLQCAELLRNGAPGIHFYTLNRSPATRAILAALRTMHAWDPAEPVAA